MKRGLVILILTLLAITGVSAELLISQPDSVYSIGDELNLSITLSPGSDTNGFLVSKLVCKDEGFDIYRSYMSVKGNQEKVAFVDIVIENNLIGDAGGTCRVSAIFGNEEANSQNFEITRTVDVILESNTSQYGPGELAKITGRAIKPNGASVNGFVEINVGNLSLNLSGIVNDGKFEVNISLPGNTNPGVYDLEAKVYERSESGEKSNEGYARGTIRVKQVIIKAEVTMENDSVTPEYDLVYTPLLLDQAGNKIGGNEMIVTFYDPNEAVFSKDLVKSGEEKKFYVDFNYSAGNWAIEVKKEEMIAKRTFIVRELERATYSLVNGTLVIINTGNVPYKKVLKISIGSESDVKEIEVGSNNVKAFKLKVGEEGEYDIGIDDGGGTKNLGRAMLTGNAIDLESINNVLVKGRYSPIIWLVFVVILGLIIYYYYRKALDENKIVNIKSVGSPIVVDSNAPSGSAKSVSMIQGLREECSLISLKIKNLGEIKGSDSNAKDNINRALTIAKSGGAKIYVDGDYRIIIISKGLAGGKDINLVAVKIAKTMDEVMAENNKKFVHKIDYGIGVHSGELIVENRGGEFKFNSLGNTITIVKRASEKANGKVYLTENMQRKVMANVRSEKNKEENLWKLNSLRLRGESSEFINKFMNRNKDAFRG